MCKLNFIPYRDKINGKLKLTFLKLAIHILKLIGRENLFYQSPGKSTWTVFDFLEMGLQLTIYNSVLKMMSTGGQIIYILILA